MMDSGCEPDHLASELSNHSDSVGVAREGPPDQRPGPAPEPGAVDPAAGIHPGEPLGSAGCMA
jgi:hypothetical protein